MMASTNHGEKLFKEFATRKRNLSEFTGDFRSRKDETMKETGWIPPSPKSLVNTHYQLGVEIGIPSPRIARFDDAIEYGDITYRKRLDDLNVPRSQLDLFDSTEELSGAYHNFLRKRSSTDDTNHQDRGWSQFALQAMNMVAGKAWEFCKNGAAIFRGFHAGGGTKYNLKCTENSDLYFEAVETKVSDQKSFSDLEPKFSSNERPQTCQNPHSRNSENIKLQCTSPRSSKRYQLTSNNNDSLERNWVVIPTVTSTPKKSCYEPVVNRKLPPTNLPRCSSAHSRTSCRFGASRSPFGSFSSRRPNFQPLRPQVSHAGSPSLSSSQKASFASPRSPRSHIPRLITPISNSARKSTNDLFLESPAALESKRQAQQWALLLKKGEKKQDESIQRLDERLKAMIREGKEALGSKIEISIEEDDEDPL